MIIRNFYDEKLSQASYLIGCAATGEAIVIDPIRDIGNYIATAESQNLRIVAVTETHIHADFLSGTRELASATGAVMYLSDEGGDDWKYDFSTDRNVQLLKDGSVIKIGNVSLRTLHTPGHTPEHLSFLLTDHPAGEVPHSLFTGDFIFIGDVGRPDLLERAAHYQGTMEIAARTLYRSLAKVKDLPDSVLIWPGHGAGSACGKSLGGSPVSSLGYERKTNWAFQAQNEDQFVDEVLSGQPEPPHYFKEMKRLNKLGPSILGSLPVVPEVEAATAMLVDIRDGQSIRSQYWKNSLVIPSGKGFTNWAGWLLNYDQPIVLIADSQKQADVAVRDLATIGLDVVTGWIRPGRLHPSQSSQMLQITSEDIEGNHWVLDVRSQSEWRAGHVARAQHIPLGYLQQRLEELPRDQTIVVHCAAGGRSPIAASILLKAGFQDVLELPGGFTEIARSRRDLLESQSAQESRTVV